MAMPDEIPQAAAVQLEHALESLEAQRRRAASATVVLCAQIVLLALVWGVVPMLRGEWAPGGLFAAVIAIAGANLLLGLSIDLWRGRANRIVVPILAEALGGMTARIRSGGPALEALPGIGALFEPQGLFDLGPAFELGLLAQRQRAWADWTLAGEHRSLAFTTAAVVQKWWTGGRSRRARRSDHVVISIAVPVPFHGRVLIARDGGALEPVLDHLTPLLDAVFSRQDSPQRLHAPFATFERRFTVRADDPAEAQRLVTPAVADGLLAIDDAHSDRSVRAAFHGGRLWLVLDLPGPMLQQPSLLRPAPAMLSRVRDMADELSLPRRLIDQLHGGPPA
jgi:hypothetical protein